ncbi:MAG: hypothetical protein LBC73_06955 [Oscillospiraceae bacterium]|nr:hypothetical protein [Oscillospiraceae bacterium]
MKKYLFLLGLCTMLLLSCNVEAESNPSGNNEKTIITNDGGNTDMDEKVIFDRENTINIIKTAIDRSDREVEQMVDLIESAGVRGAVRAQLLDSLELDKRFPTPDPRLEIESEDNRIYHLYLSFRTRSGFDNNRMYVVARIYDIEGGFNVFNIEWNECGMFSDEADFIAKLFEDVVFDHENTVRVIQKALNIDERDAKSPLTMMARLGIRGVVNAQEVKDLSVAEDYRVLDIVTEDNHHYRLILNFLYVISKAIDLETNETIFPKPR